ncbi:MAG: TonB-dependent receptor [Gammaproteobacteria bacterium]|nr:TonB-dependent receptor [Gammaproteobacteria bacterium]
MRSTALLAAAAVGILAASFTVYADDAGPVATEKSATPVAASSAPAATQEQLATIVVTATKRSTDLQDTPISLTAVTGEELASRGVMDLQTLARSVPGLAIRDAGPGQSEFEMRGLYGLGGNSSVVGFYIDEIPLASPAFSNMGRTLINPNLYDLERVEVLRGPQGTLYGSSSLAGTIRLIPSLPELNTYSLSAQEVISNTFDGGNINHQENVMMNLPLGDTAALRVVGSFANYSGWIERRVIESGAVTVDPGVYPNVYRPANFYTAPLQEDLGGTNTTNVNSIRATILWKPTDNFTIEPTLMYQLTELGAAPVVDVNGSPTYPQTPSVLAHWEPFDVPEPQHDSFTFGSLKLVYQFPSFSVTSATGLWHRNAMVIQDATEGVNSVFGIPAYNAAAGGLGPLGPEPNGPGATEQDAEWQASEELRLTSTNSGPLQWVLGYFYQDLHSQFNQYLISPEAAHVVGAPPWMFLAFQPQVITQNAFFGNVTWQITPHFSVEAGLRHYHYSLSNQDTEYGVFGPNAYLGNDVPYYVEFSNEASGNLPEFTLTYNISPDHMIYAKASEGFRIGGANNPAPAAPLGSNNAFAVSVECGLQAKVLLTSTCSSSVFLQTPTTFASDKLWSYELGWKSSFLEHRMLVDFAAYYEKWENPQLPTNIAGFFLDANGANADIKGIEAQLRTLLPWGFDLSLNGAYTHTAFADTSTIIGFPEGMQVPDTPEWTASAVLQWKHDLKSNLSLFGSVEENYVGTRISEPVGVTATVLNINQVLVHLPSYNILNLRFGITGEANAGARWSAALFVNNVLNNQALLDPQPNQGVQTPAFQRYTINQPITAGLDFSYRFH